jgi:AcrR family transcriptional regulator
MARDYTMQKRAESRDQTRARILKATIELHDEKGVAPTTFADIAKRAAVGQATVSRHFPALSELIMACGAHVWADMRPPVPETAASVFAGLGSTQKRLAKLIQELDDFYGRGEPRLRLILRDRELVPELQGFLSAVESGIEALVRQALANSGEPEPAIKMAIMLTSFSVWLEFNDLGLPASKLAPLKLKVLECAIKAARQP